MWWVSSYIGRSHRNGKEGATSTRTNTGESHNIMLNKKLFTKEDTLYESIYAQFTDRRSQCVVIEVRMWSPLGATDWVGGHRASPGGLKMVSVLICVLVTVHRAVH